MIFLTVRALPLELARKKLAPLIETGTPGDVEDVVCALAFAGDPDMGKWFSELAERPSPAMVARIRDKLYEIELLEAVANEEVRDILRSYRAYEILARTNYFFLADQGRDASFPHRDSLEGKRYRVLWKEWLARYPGHPGSDEVAIALGDHWDWNNDITAAYWYDRAATLPDQHRTSKALRNLVYIAERRLSGAELEKLLLRDVRNRELLRYIAIRRISTDVNYASAVDALDRHAERNPQSNLALAWRPQESPGSNQDSSTLRLGLLHDKIAGARTMTERLFPPRESMPLSVPNLARQFSVWRQLASLERQREEGNTPEVMHTIADVLLANRHALFPVYAHRTALAGHMLGMNRYGSTNGWGRWLRGSVSAGSAYLTFREAELAFPKYERTNELLLGQAEALAQLLDCKPLWVIVGSGTGPRERNIEAVLAACQRCRDRFPESECARRADQIAQECRARFPKLR